MSRKIMVAMVARPARASIIRSVMSQRFSVHTVAHTRALHVLLLCVFVIVGRNCLTECTRARVHVYITVSTFSHSHCYEHYQYKAYQYFLFLSILS